MKFTVAQFISLSIGVVACLTGIVGLSRTQVDVITSTVLESTTLDWETIILDKGQTGLTDEAHVPLPVYTPLTLVSASEANTILEEYKYNINTASADVLDKLPGIGPTTSARIVEHRETHGDFSTIWELADVPRLSKSTVEKISNLITVGSPSPPDPPWTKTVAKPKSDTEPSKSKTGSGTKSESVSLSGEPININIATLEELDKLPRVGPALAQRIIDYREQNGPFQSPEDLTKVKGIGERTYEHMKNLVTVE